MASLLLLVVLRGMDAAEFDTLFRELGFSKSDYTETELDYFRENFGRHLKSDLSERRGEDLSSADMHSIFLESEPVVTGRKAVAINESLNGGMWEAENSLR